MNQEESSSLEQKEAALYSRGKDESIADSFHVQASTKEFDLPHSWTHRELHAENVETRASSFGLKLLAASLVLCLGAGGYLYWNIRTSKNNVDSKKIELNLTSSPLIEGGKEERLFVVVSNKNEIPLENAKLIFTYEKGVVESGEERLVKVEKDIGRLLPQDVKQQEFNYIVYGGENEKRSLSVQLVYYVQGAGSPFTKDAAVAIALKSPPVLAFLEGENTLTPNDEAVLQLRVKNNSPTTTPRLIAKVVFPPQFKFLSSSVSPLQDTTVWLFDGLKEGEERSIEIRGSVTGSSGEKLSVRVMLGTPSQGNTTVEPVFSVATKDFSIAEPGLLLSMRAVTDRGETDLLRYGDRVRMEFVYENTGSTTLSNTELQLTFSGAALSVEPSTVIVEDGGYYDSTKHTIIWNAGATKDLENLAPKTKRSVWFSFVAPRSADSTMVTFNTAGSSENKVNGRGARVEYTGLFKLQGSISVLAQTLHSTGIWKNSGPLPPVANQSTSYTLALTASSQSDAKDFRVTFRLPAYVTWKGTSTSTVSYDSRVREVTWYLSTLNANTVATSSVQVEVRPSLSHVSTEPAITSGLVVSGTLIESSSKVSDTLNPLTTKRADPGAKEGNGTVQAK